MRARERRTGWDRLADALEAAEAFGMILRDQDVRDVPLAGVGILMLLVHDEIDRATCEIGEANDAERGVERRAA